MSQRNQKLIVSGTAAVLARRYAGAFYELAEDQKVLDTVAADLRVLLKISEEDADFISIANHPRLSRSQLVKVADKLSETMKFNKLTGKFLALIAEHRRMSILSAIIQAFLAKLAEHRGEHTAHIRSAAALSAQQTDQLAARLATLAGGKVHIDVREDKSLIGGLTVQLGSRLIDASIKSKLQRLERNLKSEAA